MNDVTVGIGLVAICALLEGFAQVFLKKSVAGRLRWQVWIALAIVAFITESLIYTKALTFLDVSIAFPLGSLNLIAVTVLSQWILRERVTKMRWIGVVLILAGVSCIAAQA